MHILTLIAILTLGLPAWTGTDSGADATAAVGQPTEQASFIVGVPGSDPIGSGRLGEGGLQR